MNVAIIGASGYSGAELLHFLLQHPHITIHKVFANTAVGKRVDEVYPQFRKKNDLVYEQYSLEKVQPCELIFIALPSGEAMHLVPDLLNAKKRVIDLGGDFRLRDAEIYTQYYKHPHTASSFLSQSVYGLSEWNKEEIRNAQLIANPGCYPTSILLPLLPLLKENVIQENTIVINSLSGTSGAGRSSTVELSFSEMHDNVRAYKVGNHQHIPEIQSIIHHFTQKKISVNFIPHLIPLTRGIYTSISCNVKSKISQEEIFTIYKKYYSNSPFIRLLQNTIPEIKNVVHTNYCDISWTIQSNNNHLNLFSTIDNMIKGAAGQAIQNMNIMFGYKETEGVHL